MERENNFYVRLDLQIKAEGGKEVLGMINDFLNNPGIGVGRVTLVGVSMVNETPRTVSLLDTTTQNPLLLVDQEGRDTVFKRLTESVKSGLGYIIDMDTPVKLTRSLPGLTKESLIYWEKKGYIHPEMVQRGGKKGRVYSTSEAFKVAHIWKFSQEGFGLPTAVKMAEQELLKIKENQLQHETQSSGIEEQSPLQRHSKPFYLEIAESLKKKIVLGQYPVGARLPSESDLIIEHKISRGTVREAVRVLIEHGFVSRIQGKGTFVIKNISE